MIGLEYICKLHNMEFKAIADKLDITPQTVNSWLRGKRPIPVSRLEELEKIFNIPRQYFKDELLKNQEVEIQKLKLLHELNEGLNDLDDDIRRNFINDLICELKNKL